MAASGETGPTGPTGIGLSGVEAYDPVMATTYSVGQVVTYGGGTYIVDSAPPSGTPDTSSDYTLLAAPGETGPAGATGITGSTGPTGPPGSPVQLDLPGQRASLVQLDLRVRQVLPELLVIQGSRASLDQLVLLV